MDILGTAIEKAHKKPISKVTDLVVVVHKPLRPSSVGRGTWGLALPFRHLPQFRCGLLGAAGQVNPKFQQQL